MTTRADRPRRFDDRLDCHGSSVRCAARYPSRCRSGSSTAGSGAPNRVPAGSWRNRSGAGIRGRYRAGSTSISGMDAGEAAKLVQRSPKSDSCSGGDVVRLARSPAFDEQAVGPGHVAHVGEIALAVEVARPRDRFGLPLMICTICSAKAVATKLRRLAGADVIAGPRGHDGHAVAARIEQGGRSAAILETAYRLSGVSGASSSSGVTAGDAPVHLRGGDDQQAGRGAPTRNASSRLMVPSRLDGEHEVRVGPAHRDEGDACEVDARVRREFAHRSCQDGPVAQVAECDVGGEAVPAGWTASKASGSWPARPGRPRHAGRRIRTRL